MYLSIHSSVYIHKYTYIYIYVYMCIGKYIYMCDGYMRIDTCMFNDYFFFMDVGVGVSF